jgi:hypothetical protein
MSPHEKRTGRINIERLRQGGEIRGEGREKTGRAPAILLAMFFALLIILLIQAEYTEFFTNSKGLPLIALAGIGLLVFVVSSIAAAYISKFQPEVRESRASLFTFGLLVAFILLAAKLFAVFNWSNYLIPVSFITMILALVYSQIFAIQTTVGLCVFIAINVTPAQTVQFNVELFFVLLTGALVAAFGVGHIENRTRLIRVGVLAGIGNAAAILGWRLAFHGEALTKGFESGLLAGFAAQPAKNLGDDMFLGFANGVLVGFLFSGLLPFIEKIFRITTDISLIELSDQNQPILRQFFLKAPGSYQHALIVGNLSEAAANAIDANPFLARVGAYFHDIGKITRPEYFTENEPIMGSRHLKLSPAMSTLIITAHVKDGVELAEELGLPPKVIDIVRTHHGTSRIEYFYFKAKKEAEKDALLTVVDEASFRYPGPRPALKEAGIVMLADSVEAVSRTLDEPTPKRIEDTVESIINRKITDGQLDDSGLTLTDLKKIKTAFSMVLVSFFHNRIKYPWQTEQQKSPAPQQP